MPLERIILTNFKNYAYQQLDCSPQLNGFVGLNGMGKTNLLDAIYYLCMTKSHFTNSDRYVVQHEAEFFRLEGIFSIDGQQERIVVKVQPGKKKQIERNDRPYERFTDHVGFLPVVLMAPDDTRLALEGSEERRRLLDNTLSQLDAHYLQHLLLYNRLLKQRNAYLKNADGRQPFRPALLATYDRQMEEPAAAIYARRMAFAEKYRPLFQTYYGAISGERETVDLEFRSQLSAGGSLAELLATVREKDRLLQRSTLGCHRDDLAFFIEGAPLKRFASQGQLKSFVLALKLAQYELLRQEKNTPPLLLLDDIFDKLDEERVRHLLALIIQRDFGQVFITDTHADRLCAVLEAAGAEFRMFEVSEGRVEEK